MTQRDENQTRPMTEFERKWIAEHPEIFAAMQPITPGMFKGKPNFERDQIAERELPTEVQASIGLLIAYGHDDAADCLRTNWSTR